MVYLPAVAVGAMTGVAVRPPGQRIPPPRPPVAGGFHVLTKCFFQRSSPLSASSAKMLSETPATIAICLAPPGMVTLSTISGGKSACIWRTSLSSLIFHSSLVSRTLDVVKIFSSFCHAVRLTSPPSVSQSALQARTTVSVNTQTIDSLRISEPFQRAGHVISGEPLRGPRLEQLY